MSLDAGQIAGDGSTEIVAGSGVNLEGVEILLFGPPGSVNDWYYKNLDHVLRFINVPPT